MTFGKAIQLQHDQKSVVAPFNGTYWHNDCQGAPPPAHAP